MPFAELIAATHFSFLRGASPPSDMVSRANELEMAGIGIADRNTVAGVVQAYLALKKANAGLVDQGLPPNDFDLVVGTRLVFADGTPDIVAYPVDRAAWGRLTRLLSIGNRRAKKGDCHLELADLLEWQEGLLLIVTAPDAALLERLRDVCPGRVWLAAAMPRGGRDRRRLAARIALAREVGVPLLATNDALYATYEQRPLHDVLTCIREGTTIAAAGRRLAANAERHLKAPAEMARLFRDCPEAVEESVALLKRITFRLTDLKYEYPHEPVPDGWEAQDWLEHLTLAAARKFYGFVLPEKVQQRLDEEFVLIRDQKYAHYFLTVHDLVRFARSCEPPILCQGRGSAANSIVCFLLGVTSVDPSEHDLLFSRFVSEQRGEPPDIDVDFEHERREEVIQYIYTRYGRERAGIAATVIHYRPRSAVAEVGKVLGLTRDVTQRLGSTVWGSFAGEMEARRYTSAGFDIDNPEIAQLRWLVDQILKFPRHLSQHVGGFVLTQGRLDEMVPIHNGAMEGRTFIEWDKDDIDALGLMKVDVLALGMLTCIRKAFDLLRRHDLGEHDLTVDLKADDEAVYEMLHKGDSIGVFQVESRAQMNMLPRLKPVNLYDLSVQVAIVRPGPIEGDMVHPYLRRREKQEVITYPSPKPPHDPNELRTLLDKTYGVPLFQEQVMKLAIVAADFKPGEANELRRAMATFRNPGTIQKLREKLIEGMTRRGYEPDFAERCFRQIEGFGSYGFPESHALSFARLVYVSSWIKCKHPAVFACALLNSQPMGFYAPAQIVRDARDHDVEVRGIDVNVSGWDNALEESASDRHPGLDPGSRFPGDVEEEAGPRIESGVTKESGSLALRLGFRQMDGFRERWAEAIVAAQPFAGVEELARRARLPQRALRLLADADAFRSIGYDRREALWEVRRTPDAELPLFAHARAAELGAEPEMTLPAMPDVEHVVTDYQTLRLSLKGHPLQFLRERLDRMGVASCADIGSVKAGTKVVGAGLVLVRQRPGKGNAIFVTLEDETGITNVVLWARLFEAYRREVMGARLMLVEGEVQRSREGIVHLMGARVRDRSDLLDTLGEAAPSGSETVRPIAARHPRDVRLVPKSRDFH